MYRINATHVIALISELNCGIVPKKAPDALNPVPVRVTSRTIMAELGMLDTY
jgi:hypothetical protein